MTQTGAALTALAYHLPAQRLTNAELSADNPEWNAEKIESKTGIVERRIAGPEETASDLALQAARKVFAVAGVAPQSADYVVYCTQSPDYLLPSNACLIQQELGLPTTAGAIDLNLGCSGFVYGLGLCKGLIETGQAKRILLLTADTYSKHIHPADRSVRTIFGDAAAAALVEGVESDTPILGPFRYGTDGRGGGNLTVPSSGMRYRVGKASAMRPPLVGGSFGPEWLYMDGAAIFTFTLGTIPKLVAELNAAAGLSLDDIDLIVPHQANAYMLEALRKRLKVPPAKFFVDVRDIGNTVSATVPIALVTAASRGLLRPGHRVMLLGFGVGLSWAGAMMRWRDIAMGVSDAARDD